MSEHLKLVSEQSDAEMARHRERERLDYALRDLAANLLRVMAGAGKPDMIFKHAKELLEADAAYIAAGGFLSDPRETLKWRGHHRTIGTAEDQRRWESDGSHEMEDAREDVTVGALRMVAAKLTRNLSHESQAESKMYDGMVAYFRARDAAKVQRTKGNFA